MQEQIFNSLNEAVRLYNEINSIYSNKLPQNILDSCKDIIENDIPKRLNEFIHTINMAEQSETYPKIETIQEGILVFDNPQLEISIQNAIKNTSIVGQNQMSTEETLVNLQKAIVHGLEGLEMQIAVAKLP